MKFKYIKLHDIPDSEYTIKTHLRVIGRNVLNGNRREGSAILKVNVYLLQESEKLIYSCAKLYFVGDDGEGFSDILHQQLCAEPLTNAHRFMIDHHWKISNLCHKIFFDYICKKRCLNKFEPPLCDDPYLAKYYLKHIDSRICFE